MFEQLFSRRAAVVRHHSSPFAAERLRYLSRLLEEGHSHKPLVRNHLLVENLGITLRASRDLHLAGGSGKVKTPNRSDWTPCMKTFTFVSLRPADNDVGRSRETVHLQRLCPVLA